MIVPRKFTFDYIMLKLKLKLIYDRQSVGQSVLVSGVHLGPVTNFSFSSKFHSDICVFVILYHPLWREDGSVIFCTIASRPCQSSHSWVEVPQNSRPYFTVWSETPQPGGPGSRIYVPQEQGGPVIPPGTGFHFRRLLTTRRAVVEVYYKANKGTVSSAVEQNLLLPAMFLIIGVSIPFMTQR
jgi:hypothetical protein